MGASNTAAKADGQHHRCHLGVPVKFRELPTAIFGRLGELVASRAFKRDGFGVLAAFKFSGEQDDEAPAIESSGSRDILPDLEIYRGGERLWVEVKTYKTHGHYGRLKFKSHGLPVYSYDAFARVEQQTGSPVFLAINEISSGMLLMTSSPLTEMQKWPCGCGCNQVAARCVPRKKYGNRYPQWYFDRDTFTARYQLDTGEIEHLRTEHARLIDGHAMQRHGEQRGQAQGSLFSFADLVPRDPWSGGSH